MEIYLLTQVSFQQNFLVMSLLMMRFTGKVKQSSETHLCFRKYGDTNHDEIVLKTIESLGLILDSFLSSDDTVVEESQNRRIQTPSVKSERSISESSGMVAAYWTPQESPGRESENQKMVVHSIPVQLASPVNTLHREPTGFGNSLATP